MILVGFCPVKGSLCILLLCNLQQASAASGCTVPVAVIMISSVSNGIEKPFINSIGMQMLFNSCCNGTLWLFSLKNLKFVILVTFWCDRGPSNILDWIAELCVILWSFCVHLISAVRMTHNFADQVRSLDESQIFQDDVSFEHEKSLIFIKDQIGWFVAAFASAKVKA